jgi:hypothetical protein
LEIFVIGHGVIYAIEKREAVPLAKGRSQSREEFQDLLLSSGQQRGRERREERTPRDVRCGSWH